MRWPDSESGTAVVEAALTVVLLFMLLFGIVEAARLFHVQQTLTDAAREGARLAVTPLQGTSTLPTADEIRARVRVFLETAGIIVADDGITIVRPPDDPVNCVVDDDVCIQVDTTPTKFTRVTVQYQFIPVSMFSLGMTLQGKVLMRNETSP